MILIARIAVIAFVTLGALVHASSSTKHSMTLTLKDGSGYQHTATAYYCANDAKAPLDDLASQLNAAEPTLSVTVLGNAGRARLSHSGSLVSFNTRTSSGCGIAPLRAGPEPDNSDIGSVGSID